MFATLDKLSVFDSFGTLLFFSLSFLSVAFDAFYPQIMLVCFFCRFETWSDIIYKIHYMNSSSPENADLRVTSDNYEHESAGNTTVEKIEIENPSAGKRFILPKKQGRGGIDRLDEFGSTRTLVSSFRGNGRVKYGPHTALASVTRW